MAWTRSESGFRKMRHEVVAVAEEKNERRATLEIDKTKLQKFRK